VVTRLMEGGGEGVGVTGGPSDTAGAAEKKVRGAQVTGLGGGKTSKAKVVRWEQEQLVEEGDREREEQPWVAQEEEGKCQYTHETALWCGTGPWRTEKCTGSSNSVHLLPDLYSIPAVSPKAVTLSTGLDT